MAHIDPEDSHRLREMIEKALKDHIITRDEYDKIIHQATKDGHLDPVEQALIAELQQMIQDGLIRFRALKQNSTELP